MTDLEHFINGRAWVSHACGVFHEPSERMKDVPGMVTCGDADTIRYVISREFVDSCRRIGVNIIWKSFPNKMVFKEKAEDEFKLTRRRNVHVNV